MPKDGHTSEEILRRVRNPDLVPPSQRASRVPPELDRIALKALAPDFKNRYARCEELRSDLASFLAQNHPPGRTRRGSPASWHELYAEDMAAERVEREELIAKAREWYSSKRSAGPPPVPTMSAAAAAALPPPLPGSALPPRPPTASTSIRRAPRRRR